MPDRKSPVLFLSALAEPILAAARVDTGGRSRKLSAANYQEETYWTSLHNRAKYLVMKMRHSERRDSVITKPYQSLRHGLVIGRISRDGVGSLLFHIS